MLEPLLERVAAAEPFARYHEPFVGGGALFFELARTGRAGNAPACLSDSNPNLMDAYRGLQTCVEDVIALLQDHQRRHGYEHYYAVRAEVPEGLAERAARIIYLNRTCYNGLYRENSRGAFNVPMGRYNNPLICDADNLRACAEALQGAVLEARPFETVLEEAAPGDLVYFDPPYVPLSKTSSFTRYDRYGFGEDRQRRLAEVFAELARRGVKTVLSNSMTPLVQELYAGFEFQMVYATRAVNSRADRRGRVAEALVSSF